MSVQKHTAVITIPFTSDGSREPEDIADEILHYMLQCGIEANLDEIITDPDFGIPTKGTENHA